MVFTQPNYGKLIFDFSRLPYTLSLEKLASFPCLNTYKILLEKLFLSRIFKLSLKSLKIPKISP